VWSGGMLQSRAAPGQEGRALLVPEHSLLPVCSAGSEVSGSLKRARVLRAGQLTRARSEGRAGPVRGGAARAAAAGGSGGQPRSRGSQPVQLWLGVRRVQVRAAPAARAAAGAPGARRGRRSACYVPGAPGAHEAGALPQAGQAACMRQAGACGLARYARADGLLFRACPHIREERKRAG